MEKMIQIAESYGWAVDMDSDSIEFNQCSPAGEDFSFTVLTKDASDAESLAAEVRSYTGSLALGAAISVLAVTTRMIYLLPVMGFMYILSTISVILQVGSFKLRHKRVFRMAPLHHHFELKGMHETRIVVMYYAWTLAFTILGIVSLASL